MPRSDTQTHLKARLRSVLQQRFANQNGDDQIWAVKGNQRTMNGGIVNLFHAHPLAVTL